jgi:selenide,water dikinase
MAELAQVLRPLLDSHDPNALVDASTGDDAAVYLLDSDGDRALVVTLDFFTPVVDDPFDFGRIAAANALSDIYAMGATPRFALNLLGFPRSLLGEGLVERIIEGGRTIADEARIPILGGHSVDDPEPKYGMVVIGEVSRERLVTNAGARPGDALVLTKALGTGIITTALKNDAVPAEAVAEAVAGMVRLNAPASAVMLEVGVHAATDVTGFGLLGHLRSLLRASECAAQLEAASVPVLAGTRELAEQGQVPGGSRRNLDDLAADVHFDSEVDDTTRLIFGDAQTSGGLLIAVPPERVEALLRGLASVAPGSAVIGRVTEGEPGRIEVRPGTPSG